MKFGVRLRLEREIRGLSQSALAVLLKTSGQHISLWELGVKSPNMIHIIELCQIFDLSADYMLGLKDKA